MVLTALYNQGRPMHVLLEQLYCFLGVITLTLNEDFGNDDLWVGNFGHSPFSLHLVQLGVACIIVEKLTAHHIVSSSDLL